MHVVESKDSRFKILYENDPLKKRHIIDSRQNCNPQPQTDDYYSVAG